MWDELEFAFALLVSGLTIGLMYSLIALGFVLIYKASGVFNFAQGAMVLFSALTFVSLIERNVSFGVALIITAAVMAQLLDAGNGVSTSSFRLYDVGGGKVTVSLNNFCKLQEMSADDEDDVLSCVHFLLVDVMSARRLIGGLV